MLRDIDENAYAIRFRNGNASVAPNLPYMSSFRRRNDAFFNNAVGRGVETNSLVTILRHARKTGSLSITGKDLSALPLELFSNELAEGEKFWECEPITQLDLSFNRINSVGPQMAGFSEAQLMKFRSNEIL